jgi:hypothetical protein
MGKIKKEFVAKIGRVGVWDEALVDTGADITVFSKAAADGLKVPGRKVIAHTVGGIGGAEVKGYAFMADIEVDKAKVTCPVFVPTKSRANRKDKFKKTVSQDNLLGHDFLQRAGAVLDYSKAHNQVFSIPDKSSSVGLLRSVPTSRKDSQLLMREARAIFGKNDKKHLTRREQEETRREVAWLRKEIRALIRK